MAGARVIYPMEELNTHRRFHVVGTGLTRAAAVAEANAKLALTVGYQFPGTVSEPLAIGETGDVNADTQFSDAEITLINGAGRKVTVDLDNVTTAIGTGIDGDIDLTNPLVVAFATAYRDGVGSGTYTPYRGHFVR